MMENIHDLRKLLAEPRKIVITTHRNPDGDALGSSLGLYHYLVAKGHEVSVISPSNYANFLKWMPGNEIVLNYLDDKPKGAELMAAAEVIFCLDFNATQRVDRMSNLLEEATAKKVMIDHHIDPDDFADFTMSDTSASSTAEMIVDFLEELDSELVITQDIAACLYSGVVTDTGSFQFPSTTPKTHRQTAKLIETGIDHAKIYRAIYNSSSEMKIRLLGYCITEKMKLFPEYGAALITLNRDDLIKYDVQPGDTEGIVNYPLRIEGIHFSVFMVDRTDLIKMSFRSEGDFDVNQFAGMYFDGGGHKNAAGGASRLTLRETVRKFETVLPSTKKQLK